VIPLFPGETQAINALTLLSEHDGSVMNDAIISLRALLEQAL
jgi:hypothetical protein